MRCRCQVRERAERKAGKDTPLKDLRKRLAFIEKHRKLIQSYNYFK